MKGLDKVSDDNQKDPLLDLDKKVSVRDSSVDEGAEIEFFDKTNLNVDNTIMSFFDKVAHHPWFKEAKQIDAPQEVSTLNVVKPDRTVVQPARKDLSFFDIPPRNDLDSFDDFAILGLNEKQFFFRQAKLYENKEGQVCEEVPFNTFFPQYSRINNGQLDWYFYWRGNLRKGIYIKTSASYHFLYWYELINLVGFDDPKKAFEQLLFVWKEARYKDSLYDSYLCIWVRDFIIFYNLELEYYDVVAEISPELAGKYFYQESILNYFVDGTKSGILYALQECSDYPVTESNFCKNGYFTLVEDAVCYMMSELNKKYIGQVEGNLFFAMAGVPTDTFIFKPFASSLFYERGQSLMTLTPRVSAHINYSTSLSSGICSTFVPNALNIKKWRKFVTGVLRTVESVLRELTKYRWSLNEGLLPKSRVALIRKQTADFYINHLAQKRKMEKKIFRVNDALLSKLKEDSEHIRQRLISEQNADHNESANEDSSENLNENLNEKPNKELSEKPNKELNKELNEDPTNSNCQETAISVNPGQAHQEEDTYIKQTEVLACKQVAVQNTGFSSLHSLLSDSQRKILRELCNSSPGIDSTPQLVLLAREANSFLNVIIEEINEIAIAHIGDFIIDTDGSKPCICEDYLEDTRIMFENN